MVKKYGDLMAGVFVAAFSIMILIASGFIRQTNANGVGAEFVPRVVATAMLGLSILLIIRGVNTVRKYGPIQEEAVKPAYGVMLISLIMMIIYVALLSSVGFIITTAVYLFLQITLVSKKEEINYIKFAIISVLSAIIIFLVFVHVFGIMVPSGILG